MKLERRKEPTFFMKSQPSWKQGSKYKTKTVIQEHLKLVQIIILRGKVLKKNKLRNFKLRFKNLSI